MLTISEHVRHAIERSGLTRYRLAMEAGVPQSALSRFVNGQGSMTLDTLDRIGAVLRLRVVMDGPTKRTRALPKRGDRRKS